MYYLVANVVKVLIFYKISTNGSTLFKIGVDGEDQYVSTEYLKLVVLVFLSVSSLDLHN